MPRRPTGLFSACLAALSLACGAEVARAQEAVENTLIQPVEVVAATPGTPAAPANAASLTTGKTTSDLTSRGPEGQILREKIVDRRDPVAAQQVGWAYYENAQWPVAERWFSHALEFDPANSRAAEGLIMTAYRSGDTRRAYDLAATHQSLVPSGRDIVATAAATTASQWIESGDIDKAQSLISQFPPEEKAFDGARHAIAERQMKTAVVRREFDEARTIAAQNQIDPAAITREESAQILNQAADARDAGQHRDSLQLIEKAETVAPLSRNGRQMKAWTLYKNRQYDQSAEMFETLYREGADRDSAEGLTHSLQQAGRMKELAQLNRELGGPLAATSDPVLHAAARADAEKQRREREEKLAAERRLMAENNSPQPATPENPTVGGMGSVIAAAASTRRMSDALQVREGSVVATPRITAGGAFRQKSGSGGLDRLSVTQLPSVETTLVFGENRNQSLTFAARALSLESGDLKGGRLVGSAESTLDPITLVTDTDTLVEPRLTYRLQKGDSTIVAAIGSTPLGADISAKPVGELGVDWRGDTASAGLRGFSESVTESLLSYTGMNDPHTGRDWGRVVRSGVRADGALDLGGGWSANGLFEYSVLQGEGVADNSAIAANLGLAYQLDIPGFEYVSVGPSFHFESYEKNLSQFTAGHGGYFSPDQLMQGMLGVSFLTETGGAFLAEGFVGVGAQTNDQAAAPVLPLASDGRLYDASSDSSAIFTARLQALFELNPQWRLGAQAGYAKTAAFDDFAVGLYLSYLFEPQSGGLGQSDLAH